jgi:hypothetical protein
MSDFLLLIRQRLRKKNEATGDIVPWHLDDKATAYAFASEIGIRTPRRSTHPDPESALAKARASGEVRCIIKESHRHSVGGVYAIEVQRDGSMIDFMSLTEISIDTMKRNARPHPEKYWLLEEWVEGNVAGRPIPFDYKFYCFGGQVALVLQMDRNASPPRFAIFDGTWMPLEPTRHYDFDPKRWLPGFHVIPRHASRLMTAARTLSKATGASFVSVDMYDGKDGPVFGEFTFAPGSPDVGMIVFSPNILKALDDAVHGKRVPPLSGFDIDTSSLWRAMEKDRLPSAPSSDHLFSLRSATASAGDRRYARLFGQSGGQLGRHYYLCACAITALGGNTEFAYPIGKDAALMSGFFSSSGRSDEFLRLALESCKTSKAPWVEERSAEIKELLSA